MGKKFGQGIQNPKDLLYWQPITEGGGLLEKYRNIGENPGEKILTLTGSKPTISIKQNGAVILRP